jgi:hypothetical protein
VTSAGLRAVHPSRDTGRAKEARERYQHFLEMEGGTPEQRKAAEKSLDRLKGRP